MATSRLVGLLSLITLCLTVLWAGLLAWGAVAGEAVETLDQALRYASARDWRYTLTYANAVLITLAATALFAALYAHYRRSAPAWCAVGVAFVPVYCGLNLLVYASQITIVPQLVASQELPGYGPAAAFLTAQMVQAWPGSAISVVNGLAYAVLGIPSIIFGLLLARGTAAMRTAGVLLILNAMACLAGPLGAVTGSPVLALGTVVGGAIFLLSLIPLTIAFLAGKGPSR